MAGEIDKFMGYSQLFFHKEGECELFFPLKMDKICINVVASSESDVSFFCSSVHEAHDN